MCWYGVVVVACAFAYFKGFGGVGRLQSRLQKQQRDDTLNDLLFDATPTSELRDRVGLDEELLTRDVDEMIQKLLSNGSLASREAADQIKDMSSDGKAITKAAVKDAVEGNRSGSGSEI